MDEKRRSLKNKLKSRTFSESSEFPENAQVCKKCSVKSSDTHGWMHDLPKLWRFQVWLA